VPLVDHPDLIEVGEVAVSELERRRGDVLLQVRDG